MKTCSPQRERMSRRGQWPLPASHAFTLMEVMIAVGIFTLALLSILGAMSRGLAGARSLQSSGPDCGMLAAELSLTNQLPDGKSESGDFGRHYPGYTWTWESYEVSSNGLFQVDFVILKNTSTGKELHQSLSVLMYKPDSQRGMMGGGRSGLGR